MACLQEQTTVSCKKAVLNNPFVAQTTGKSPASQGNGQVAGQGTAPNAGDSLLQINAGPGALAMSMIFEAMDLYASVINLQKEQRVAMINTQANSAQAQADETVAEGKAAFQYALAAGLTTIGTAVGSLATALTLQKVMGRTNAADEERLNTKQKPMQTVEGNLEEKPIVNPAGQDAKTLGRPGAEQRVQARMKEFSRHEYENASYTDKQLKEQELPESARTQRNAETKEAVRRLKGIRLGRRERYSGFLRGRMRGHADEFNGFDYNEWKGDFYERYDAGRTESLSISNRQNTISQYANMGSTVLSSIGQGASGAIQGKGQEVQAQHRAAASLDQVSSSMAGGNSQESAQAMSKAADAQSQEVQILREIDRANSVA